MLFEPSRPWLAQATSCSDVDPLLEDREAPAPRQLRCVPVYDVRAVFAPSPSGSHRAPSWSATWSA
jgi:hypothetical protein